MKRQFINQDKLSNKFWHAEVSGKTQKITFGKIGTKDGAELQKMYPELVKEICELRSE